MVRHPGDERSCWLPPPAVCRCRLTPWLPPAPPQMDKKQAANRHAGAAATRIRAADVADTMNSVAPQPQRRGRSAPRNGWSQGAEAGDTVYWDGSHADVPAGSPEATAVVMGGVVQGVEGRLVLVSRPKDRGHSIEPYRIPKTALTGRDRPAAAPRKKARPARQQTPNGPRAATRPVTTARQPEFSPKPGAKRRADSDCSAASAMEEESEEGELERLHEEVRRLKQENQLLKGQKWSSKSYHKIAGSDRLRDAEKAKDQLERTITKLQTALAESSERLESSTAA